MNDSTRRFYKGVFFAAATYDLIIGCAFLFFSRAVFKTLDIAEKAVGSEPYLSLIGAFLVVLSFGYAILHRSDLAENRNLVLVGSLYKLAYVCVAIWYFAYGNIPHPIFLTVFGTIDFIMFLIKFQCYISLGKVTKTS